MKKNPSLYARISHSLSGWLLLALLLLGQCADLALAAGLPVGQCLDCPEQGPTVVIITNMSARPGASPSLLLAGFMMLALLFGLAWLARRGDWHA